MPNQEIGIDIKDYLDIIWRYRRLFLVITFIVSLLIGGAVILQKPVYKATTSIVLGNNSPSIYTDPAIAQELMFSPAFLNGVADDLDFDINYTNLRKGIAIELEPNTNLLKIFATNHSPEYARNIAEKIVELFSAQNEKELSQQKNVLGDQLEGTKELIAITEKSIALLETLLAQEEEKGMDNWGLDQFELLQNLKEQHLSMIDLYKSRDSLSNELDNLNGVQVIQAAGEARLQGHLNKFVAILAAVISGLAAGLVVVFIRHYIEGIKKQGRNGSQCE